MTSTNLKNELSHFVGTSQWYQYFLDVLLTDGSKFFFEKTESFWLADIIATEGVSLNEHFQVWKVTVKDNEADIIVEDGNKNQLMTKHIEFTDMLEGEWVLWFIDNVILLPSEY